MEARNTKITWSVTTICACFMICTFPHKIYCYMTNSHGFTEVLFYNVTLGLQWAQYCCNFLMHGIQRNQIWNASLFYLDTKLSIVMHKNKITKKRETEFSVFSASQTLFSEKTEKTMDCTQLNSK